MSRRGSPPLRPGCEPWAGTEGVGGPLWMPVSRPGASLAVVTAQCGGGAVSLRSLVLPALPGSLSSPVLSRALLSPLPSLPGPPRAPPPGSPVSGGNDGVCPGRTQVTPRSLCVIILCHGFSSWPGVPDAQLAVVVREGECFCRLNVGHFLPLAPGGREASRSPCLLGCLAAGERPHHSPEGLR